MTEVQYIRAFTSNRLKRSHLSDWRETPQAGGIAPRRRQVPQFSELLEKHNGMSYELNGTYVHMRSLE
jgi:hypothetical protein